MWERFSTAINSVWNILINEVFYKEIGKILNSAFRIFSRGIVPFVWDDDGSDFKLSAF
jgi:hypothetical protein